MAKPITGPPKVLVRDMTPEQKQEWAKGKWRGGSTSAGGKGGGPTYPTFQEALDAAAAKRGEMGLTEGKWAGAAEERKAARAERMMAWKDRVNARRAEWGLPPIP